MTPDQFYLVTGLPTFAAFVGIIFTLNQRIDHLHDRLRDLQTEMAGRMDRQRDLLRLDRVREDAEVLARIGVLESRTTRTAIPPPAQSASRSAPGRWSPEN